MKKAKTLKKDTPNIIRDIKQAAKNGDLHALAQLGVYYLLGHQIPRDVKRGFENIQEAAKTGEISSQTLLATLYASGMGTKENWGEAYNWLVLAAQNGDPRAVDQVTYFLPELALPTTKMTWQGVRDHLGTLHDRFELDYTVHHTQPLIRSQRNFLDQRTCDYVIKVAQPFLARAYVNDALGGAVLDESRTNMAMSFFPLENDLVIQTINKKISTFMNHPIEQAEPLSVLHYKPGQSYRDHYDYFNPDFPAHVPHLQAGGQRTKTFLVYLNDDYECGETCFPKLDWKFEGRSGEAVVFDNVDSEGHVMVNSLHAGLPPTNGEKWVISKWLKDKPQY